jgi:hypothetical protein
MIEEPTLHWSMVTEYHPEGTIGMFNQMETITSLGLKNDQVIQSTSKSLLPNSGMS